jgi:hypothetical protein
MRIASFSRIAAAGALVFNVAACGGGNSGEDSGVPGGDASLSADAPSGGPMDASPSAADGIELKATAPDDPSGTIRQGAGAAVRWQGHVYQINAAKQLTRDGVLTAELAKTANVEAVGIIDNLLVHKASGRWWQWTNSADWRDLGTATPVQNDASGTLREGVGAEIRWQGRVYKIAASGQLTENGVVTAALAKTSSVAAIGIANNVLVHKAAGGRWWQWTGTADWKDLGMINPIVPPDDVTNTFRTGVGAAVRWQGKEYKISATAQLLENGVLTPALGKTSNVTAVGIYNSQLVHKGGGSWWQWTAAADWTYVGTEMPPTVQPPPPKPPLPYQRKVPMTGSVAVPTTFSGLHAHRWPGGSSPAPTYGYGTVRSLNYDPADNLGILWYGINKSDGYYDWSKMDQWVQTHYSAGKQLIYSLYGTPAWCSSNTSASDMYNQPGGDRMPRSLTCVQKFVDALVRRYNGNGVRKLQMIEIWNEPDFAGLPYWRDTATDLAKLGRTVYQTAKAVDPGIKVLWPSFVHWSKGVTVWQNNLVYGQASDGAGGIGKNWADGFAFHFYAYETGMDRLMDYQETARKTLEALGKPNWEMFNTEMGFGDGYAATLSIELKAVLIQRWMALCAAYGNKMAVLYSHDGSNLGSPATSPQMAAAADEVHKRLAGKTIREAGVLTDGRVFVVFSDNSTWLI